MIRLLSLVFPVWLPSDCPIQPVWQPPERERRLCEGANCGQLDAESCDKVEIYPIRRLPELGGARA